MDTDKQRACFLAEYPGYGKILDCSTTLYSRLLYPGLRPEKFNLFSSYSLLGRASLKYTSAFRSNFM